MSKKNQEKIILVKMGRRQAGLLSLKNKSFTATRRFHFTTASCILKTGKGQRTAVMAVCFYKWEEDEGQIQWKTLLCKFHFWTQLYIHRGAIVFQR